MGRWEADVGFGSWLCENAKTLNRDRRSYSSRTVLVAQRASGFNLEIELKNIILCRVSVFEFLHSQGHQRTWRPRNSTSALPPKDGVIGRPSLWIAEDCWVLRFRLMVKRGPWLRPQASEGEAQNEPFCRMGRIGQGDQHLHCG